jgi:hypothetical protein
VGPLSPPLFFVATFSIYRPVVAVNASAARRPAHFGLSSSLARFSGCSRLLARDQQPGRALLCVVVWLDRAASYYSSQVFKKVKTTSLAASAARPEEEHEALLFRCA